MGSVRLQRNNIRTSRAFTPLTSGFRGTLTLTPLSRAICIPVAAGFINEQWNGALCKPHHRQYRYTTRSICPSKKTHATGKSAARAAIPWFRRVSEASRTPALEPDSTT
jgi:hypothetical protein